jgi:type VI secretion system protein ImpF
VIEKESMAKIPKKQPLVPSVLDRLLQSDETGRRTRQKGRGQLLRELKESVRRDLEDLLNTRWRCVSWPPNLDELEVSLFNYGLPDFTGANLGSAEHQEEFRLIIKKVVERFEPRLRRVQVHLVKNPDPLDRTLRFRIDALLYAEPSPEPVVFDSSIEPLSASFEVKGGER